MTLIRPAGIGKHRPPWQGLRAGALGELATPAAGGLPAGQRRHGLRWVALPVVWAEEDGASLRALVGLWVLHLAGYRVGVRDDDRSLSPYEGLV
jgi:hypothetical protein